MSDTPFKIVMRGYDRVMVDDYSARIHGEHNRALADLNTKLDALTKEKDQLVQKQQEDDTLRTDMQSTLTGAQEFINAQTQKLKASEREVDDLRRKNALYLDKQEALTRLLADAQVKCSKLVDEAQQHAGRIIQEAQQQEAAILEKAEASAVHMIAESKRDADAVQTEMRQRFNSIKDTVSAIRQMTAQIDACCEATDQMIAEPDSFFYSDMAVTADS